MLEARFDDLTGASPSFRLVEPVGVLEATRAGEVVETLEAAEAAAGRGLWVAGFVAYEAAPGLDPDLVVRSREPEDPFAGLPLAWFAMFERSEETTLPLPRDEGVAAAPEGTWVPTTPRDRFESSVDRIRELIAAGETYQVNHTMRLRSRVEGDPRGLYRDLCYAQRGAFSAYLDLGRYRILSASPELFFELRDGAIVTKPMKGTAPRGRWPEEDRRVAARLLASAKDRAENAMIVDLLRNDLGRISRTGSVTWADVFQAERYETVWQLTTDGVVRARERRRGWRACSGGSSRADRSPARRRSGRCRSSASSRTPREASTAARSAISRRHGSGHPRARFNVAIRTVTVDTASGTAEYGVGGGITWDSDAEAEYEEAVAKTRVLTARRPGFELLETMRHDPARWRPAPGPAPAAPFGVGGLLRLPMRRDRGARGGREGRGVRAGHAVPGPPAPSRGTERRGWCARRSRATRTWSASRSMTCRRIPATCSCSTRPHGASDTRRRAAAIPTPTTSSSSNDRGEVTESTIANVAVRMDGRWVTPPIGSGLLPGIGRAVALEGGTLVEAPVTIEDLRSSEELALISDTRGWRRADLV